MFCFNRLFVGMAVVAALGGSCRMASAGDDDPKPSKKEAKKIEMPKLPEGAKPKWEMESVEEKFTIIKGGTDDRGRIYFLLELKEDMNSPKFFTVNFFNAEGIKFHRPSSSCDPSTGKKGERVRLTVVGDKLASSKEIWLKAAKVQFVLE